MRSKGLLIIGLIFCLGAPLAAQVNVRGQILLPGGDVPNKEIRFFLSSDDGRVNQFQFTDSNGRFVLVRLDGSVSYTITVEADPPNYGRTRYSFIPAYQQVVRVILERAPEPRPAEPTTVSAASGYRPNPKATELHKKALKEIEKGQFVLAEQYLHQASSADPKFAAAFNDLGALLMQQNRHAEAEPILRQAAEADPKFVHALLNLGITLNRVQKYGEAIPILRELLRLAPNVVAAHAHLGLALTETDQFEEAERELLRAVRTPGPEEVLGQLYLGKLYARTGQFEKGIAALEAYLRKAPHAANAGEVRGLMERMKKELQGRR